MQISEVYGMILKRQIEGVMFHDEMAQYYAFIGLHGYKHFHKNQSKEEMRAYMRTWCFYIDQYGRLPDEQQAKDPEVIPIAWRSVNMDAVSPTVKKQAVKDAIEKYVDWENETIRIYEQACSELWDMGDYIGGEKVKQNLVEANCELRKAKHKRLMLSAVEYDLSYIAGDNA